MLMNSMVVRGQRSTLIYFPVGARGVQVRIGSFFGRIMGGSGFGPWFVTMERERSIAMRPVYHCRRLNGGAQVTSMRTWS